jgi:hypothetical protein
MPCRESFRVERLRMVGRLFGFGKTADPGKLIVLPKTWAEAIAASSTGAIKNLATASIHSRQFLERSSAPHVLLATISRRNDAERNRTLRIFFQQKNQFVALE